MKDNLYLAFRQDTARGHHGSAIVNLLRFQRLQDSLLDETRTRQMQELEIEYRTEKSKDEIKIKDQDIVVLNQKNQLQQSRLESANLTKNLVIGGIVLALIIIVLLFREYIHRQRSSEVIANKNELLQHLLTEKEWLLKEVHHRVKNNLQIVMSLLQSQSAYTNNDVALAAIHESQHRVQAMSLIHQKLYNTEDSSSIDISLYARELVSYLADAFSTNRRIKFHFEIVSLRLDVSQAIPVGLILNEAITNSLKYAFPENKDGLISITLVNHTSNEYLLSIADNGIGIPLQFKSEKQGSLGMRLMLGLSQDLDGKLSIENVDGTTIKVCFLVDDRLNHKNVVRSTVIPT